MKILHITNEFTKKNFSISTLIIFISELLTKNYNYDFKILTSSLEELFFDKKKIKIFKFNKWSDFFGKKEKLKKEIYGYDIVHIHGIWAPIQIISLIFCSRKKIQCIVHPHGMLLDEALKSAGKIKFILKKISLFILKYTLSNNVRFISITNQETSAIKKYFPSFNVTEISNPIPFNTNNQFTNNKKKKMVYFGRIHPHKNIHILIDAFKKANLSNEWVLEIYGIRDDEKYYNILKKKIENNSQIFLNNPIFGEEKQQLMKESWVNILVSKSEVLSLSILESSLNELPSLINESIEITGFKESLITTNLNEMNIANKIVEIANWTLEDRIAKGKIVSDNVKKKTLIDNILGKYNSLYESIKEHIFSEDNLLTQKRIYGILEKNFNFLLVSSTYTFNLMFGSLLVVLLVLFKEYSTAGELGLIISLWITITQIFSSNMRSIVVSEQNKNYAITTLFYRLFFSFFVLSVFFIYSIFFQFENIDLINAVSLLIMAQWINEMNLVQYEIKNKFKIFKIFFFINFLVVVLTYIFIFLGKLEYLYYLLISYTLILILSFINNLHLSNVSLSILNFTQIIKLNIKTIAFLSSFSIIISSFAWRIMLYYLFDKSLAGIFFACFSIGSFPGTLFNSVIGPGFIKQKIQLSTGLKFILFLLFLITGAVFLYSIILLNNFNSINYLGFEFVLFTISISFIGSFFMVYAMYLRHKKIQISLIERKNLFKRDIIYGISIIFFIPILFYTIGTLGVSFAFIITSLMAMITYSINIDTSNKLKN